MTARPNKPARWSDDGVSVPGRVEPNEVKKDTGYPNGEEPAAGEHNYLFGHLGDWIQYLESQVIGSLMNFFALSAVGIATASRIAHGRILGATRSTWVVLGTSPDSRYSFDGRVWAALAYDAGATTPNEALHTDVEGIGIGEIGGFWFCGSGVGAGASRLQLTREGTAAWNNASNGTAAGDSMEALAVGMVSGQWVIGVCGQGDFVQYNTDGISGAIVNSPATGEDYYGIAWSSTLNLWCIVGTNGAIITSPDLAAYTPRTADAAYAGTFGRVRWDDRNLAFIATSDDGEVQRSLDGVTWTQILTGTGTEFRASRWLQVARGIAVMAVKEAPDATKWGFAYSTDGGATWSKFMHSSYLSLVEAREGFAFDHGKAMLIAPTGALTFALKSTGRFVPE